MEGEIITVQDNVPVLSDDRIIQMAETAEKRIEAVKKIKVIALKVTNVNDWVDQQGKPYLQASGSTKVGRVFGVSWRIEEPTYEEFEDGHFQYTFKGEFSLAGSTIESLGVRSSKDGFFSTRYIDGKKTQLKGSEVDKGDVKKAALTNLLGNGVTTILGIRNMTWDEIANVTEFSKEDVTNIQYGNKKGKKPPLKPPQKSTGRGQTSTTMKDNEKGEDTSSPKMDKLTKAFVTAIEEWKKDIGETNVMECLGTYGVTTPEEILVEDRGKVFAELAKFKKRMDNQEDTAKD